MSITVRNRRRNGFCTLRETGISQTCTEGDIGFCGFYTMRMCAWIARWMSMSSKLSVSGSLNLCWLQRTRPPLIHSCNIGMWACSRSCKMNSLHQRHPRPPAGKPRLRSPEELIDSESVKQWALINDATWLWENKWLISSLWSHGYLIDLSSAPMGLVKQAFPYLRLETAWKGVAQSNKRSCPRATCVPWGRDTSKYLPRIHLPSDLGKWPTQHMELLLYFGSPLLSILK